MSQLDAVILNEVKKIQELVNTGGGSGGGTFNPAPVTTFPKKAGYVIRKGSPIAINTETGEVQEGNGGVSCAIALSKAGNNPTSWSLLKANMIRLPEGKYLCADPVLVSGNSNATYIRLMDGLGNVEKTLDIPVGAYGALVQFYRYTPELIIIIRHAREATTAASSAHQAFIFLYNSVTQEVIGPKVVSSLYGLFGFYEYGGEHYILPRSAAGQPLKIVVNLVTGVDLVDVGFPAISLIFNSFLGAVGILQPAVHKTNGDNRGGFSIMPDNKMLLVSGSSAREVYILDLVTNAKLIYTLPTHPKGGATNLTITGLHHLGNNLVLVLFTTSNTSLRACLYEYANSTLTPVDVENSFDITGSGFTVLRATDISGIKVSDTLTIIGCLGKVYELTVSPITKSLTNLVITTAKAGSSLLNIDLGVNELIGGTVNSEATVSTALPIKITPEGIKAVPLVFIGYAASDVLGSAIECPVSLLPSNINLGVPKGSVTSIGNSVTYSVTDSLALPVYIPDESEFNLTVKQDFPIHRPLSAQVSSPFSGGNYSKTLSSASYKMIEAADMNIGITLSLGGAISTRSEYLLTSVGDYHFMNMSSSTSYALFIKLMPGVSIPITGNTPSSLSLMTNTGPATEYTTFNLAAK